MLHYWTSIRRLPPRFLPFPSGTVQKRNIGAKPSIRLSVFRSSASVASGGNSTDIASQRAAKQSWQFKILQDTLKPAISVLTVACVWLIYYNSMITTNNENMKNYNESLAKFEAKLEGKIEQSKKELEVKLDKLEAKMDVNKKEMEGKLDRLEAKMEKKLDTLGAKLDKLGERRGWLW